MDDTACGCDCPLVKVGVCQSDRQCPNFIEVWWKEGEQGQQKLVKDCAPRRVLLQQSDFAHRLIGVEAATCQLRDKIDLLCSILSDLTVRSQQYIDNQKIEEQNANANINAIDDNSVAAST
jgi:hypothetical protein